MDVINPAQARIAEDAGACAVMALERVPAEIRHSGGVARSSDPEMILGIKKEVTLPVMAKVRIGHFVEAQVLQALEVDFIDESEVLTMADEDHHIDKAKFAVPFVCGCRNLGEGLRRIAEGAAMLRTKGEAGTGNVVEAVRHARTINKEIKAVSIMDDTEMYSWAKVRGLVVGGWMEGGGSPVHAHNTFYTPPIPFLLIFFTPPPPTHTRTHTFSMRSTMLPP
jgi:pyridoxal 5'-phosphate synthase pdxS subunit